MKINYPQHETQIGSATITYGFAAVPGCDTRIFKAHAITNKGLQENPHVCAEIAPYYNVLFPSGEPMNAIGTGVSLRYNPASLAAVYAIGIEAAIDLCERMIHSFSPEYVLREEIANVLSHRWRRRVHAFAEEYGLVEYAFDSFDEVLRYAQDNGVSLEEAFYTYHPETFYKGRYIVATRKLDTGQYYLVCKAWINGSIETTASDKYASIEQAVKAMKQMY
jgi:hypothetical protein